MTTITTLKEQRETSAAARKVGGYAELVRLGAERKRKGAGSIVIRDVTGLWGIKTRG